MVSLNPLTLAGVKGHAAHCHVRTHKPPVSIEMATYEIDKSGSQPTRNINIATI